MELLEHFKPVDQLEQAVYRTILRLRSRRPEVYSLESLETSDGLAEVTFKVKDVSVDSGNEASALGALAVTGMLMLRAAFSGRRSHWAVALGAGTVTCMTAGTLVKKAGRALRRVTGKSSDTAVLSVAPKKLKFRFGPQEVQVDLPPMTNIVLRTFRHSFKGSRDQFHLLQIELQDGRVITVSGWDEALVARRVGHQVARALKLSMAFQNIEVSEVENGVSWELGPQLVEPALN